MASDNEVMVLIYETVQKQLNQIKDSRIVIQSLANRTAEIEKTVKEMNESTAAAVKRIEALETAVAGMTERNGQSLERFNDSDVKLRETVNAMRATLDNVTNPSISLVSRNHSEIKDAVREMSNMHSRVTDEFEQYEIRLLKLEDNIEKMLKKQVLIAEKEDE